MYIYNYRFIIKVTEVLYLILLGHMCDTNYRCDIIPLLINSSGIKTFLKMKNGTLSQWLISGTSVLFIWWTWHSITVSWIKHHLQHLAFKRELISSTNLSSHSDLSSKYPQFYISLIDWTYEKCFKRSRVSHWEYVTCIWGRKKMDSSFPKSGYSHYESLCEQERKQPLVSS